MKPPTLPEDQSGRQESPHAAAIRADMTASFENQFRRLQAPELSKVAKSIDQYYKKVRENLKKDEKYLKGLLKSGKVQKIDAKDHNRLFRTYGSAFGNIKHAIGNPHTPTYNGLPNLDFMKMIVEEAVVNIEQQIAFLESERAAWEIKNGPTIAEERAIAAKTRRKSIGVLGVAGLAAAVGGGLLIRDENGHLSGKTIATIKRRVEDSGAKVTGMRCDTSKGTQGLPHKVTSLFGAVECQVQYRNEATTEGGSCEVDVTCQKTDNNNCLVRNATSGSAKKVALCEEVVNPKRKHK